MRNKKAIAPLFFVLIIVLTLIVIYCLLFIPIPAFTEVRMIVNYFLIVILWLVIQTGLIYAYYKLGTFVSKGIFLYRTKISKISFNIKKYIITHS